MDATLDTSPESLLEHQDFVRGLARSLLFDDHQVDDVVQQTWLSAMRSVPRDRRAVRGFLAKVVRSRASNLRRDEARLKSREAAVAAQRDPKVPSAADVAEREATRARVVQAVLGLAEPYQGTVLLRYFENRTPTEIARQLGVPPATVRTRLRRALDQLRAALDHAHGGDRRTWCLQLVPIAASYRVARTALALGLQVSCWLVLVGALLYAAYRSFDSEPAAVPTALRHEPPPAEEQRGGGSPPAGEAPRTDERRTAIATADVSGVEDPAALVGFRGRLLLPGGAAAAGREVELRVFEPSRMLPGLGAARGALRFGQGNARSDAAGVFVVRGLWPHGHYMLRTDAADDTQLCRVIADTPGPGELADLGDLVLEGVGAIAGHAVDGEGEPVAGALVWATDVGALPLQALLADQVDARGGVILGAERVHLFPDWTSAAGDILGMPSTRTDAAGAFRLDGLAEGEVSLVVSSAQHEVSTRPRVRIRAGETKDLGRVRLRDGEAIVGRVLDAKGEPVAGAEVVVAPRGIVTDTTWFGRLPAVDFARRPVATDGGGRFRVPGLPRARITIGCRRDAHSPWVVVSPSDASAEHELRLPAPQSLEVLAGDLREPRLELFQGRLRGELLLGGLAQPIPLAGRLHRTATGLRIDDLLPGTYTLLASAAGGAVTVVHAEVPGSPIALEPPPSQPLAVTVLDHTGAPLPGATVLARAEVVRDWQKSLLPEFSKVPHWHALPTFTGHTDAAGRASVAGLEHGPALVTVLHARYGTLTVKVVLPRAGETVRLPRPAELTGQLLEGMEPAPPGRYVLSLRRRDGIDPQGPSFMQRLVRPDAQGRFTVRGLLPGSYCADVLPSLDGVRSAGRMKKYLDDGPFGMFESPVSKDFELAAGPNPPLVVNANPDTAGAAEAGAEVRGTLFVDGIAAAGCEVSHARAGVFASRGKHLPKAPVAAGGSFDLGRLAVGDYFVEVFDPRGHRLWCKTVRVKPDENQELAIALETGTLTGTVLAPSGSPAAGCELEVSGGPGTAVAARADDAGRFRFEKLPAGAYSVLARQQSVGQGRVADVAVPAGGTGDAPVRLLGYVAVRGRVDRAALGVRSESCQVYIQGEQVSLHAHAEVRADGTFELPEVLPGRYWLHTFGAQERGTTIFHTSVPARVVHQGRDVSVADGTKAGFTVPAEGLSDLLVTSR